MRRVVDHRAEELVVGPLEEQVVRQVGEGLGAGAPPPFRRPTSKCRKCYEWRASLQPATPALSASVIKKTRRAGVSWGAAPPTPSPDPLNQEKATTEFEERAGNQSRETREGEEAGHRGKGREAGRMPVGGLGSPIARCVIRSESFLSGG